MRVTLDFPAAEEILREVGLDEQGDTQMFHTKNVLRRIQKYMPYRTGATIKLTVAQTDPRVPEIVTEEPQVVYLYNGVSRSGKPLNYLRFTKARFYVVDPENEYAPLVQELGGEVVNISVDSATHFNPLDFKYDKATKIPPHVAKAEFVLSLCEQIMGKEHILAGDKSLIDDALENIYKPLMESHYTAPCPTIKDLWMALNNQRDKRSKEIALALRIFATGSMQAFAQPTNVDMSNRLICFNIQSLGEQLKPVAMLSMLEYINTAVMSNERNDPKAATWVYFDEIYLLLRDSLSANFLYTSWKRFRKYNAYATGITQNVQDCLTNDTAYAMLANSEFVVMLRQTKDIDSVVELYGLSEPQRKYLLLAQPGEGIIKMGNSLIPFNNPQPKDTKTYKLLTTKPGEME